MSAYLDAAATAPLLPEARAAMLQVYDAACANPSSVHSAGERAAKVLESARATIAEAFGVHPAGVVFTSGGTEANNLGIIGRALAAPRGRHIITSAIEHSSVLQSCAALERIHGFEVDYVPVDKHGRIAQADLDRLLRPDTTLVALGLANSEVGTVADVPEVPAQVALHLDAVQAAANLPVDLSAGGWPGPRATTVALASHKFGGPAGVGALLLPRDVPLEPVIYGGGQEGGRRAGTQNVAGIAGFAAAVQAQQARTGQRALEVMASRDALIVGVEKHVPGAQLTGHRTERLPNHASFVVEGISGEALLVALDVAGFAASSGSACRAGSAEPSPVLTALGYSPELAQSALRFSLPAPLPQDTIDAIVRVMSEQ